MLYLDTSLLVAAVANEPATERVQLWLSEQNPDDLAISDWVVTEFSSALSIKVRTGALTVQHRAAALTLFNRLVAESFQTLPVQGSHFRIAARFADDHSQGLRAGDALHLAIAGERGATLCTLDRRLAEAGLAMGIATHMLATT